VGSAAAAPGGAAAACAPSVTISASVTRGLVGQSLTVSWATQTTCAVTAFLQQPSGAVLPVPPSGSTSTTVRTAGMNTWQVVVSDGTSRASGSTSVLGVKPLGRADTLAVVADADGLPTALTSTQLLTLGTQPMAAGTTATGAASPAHGWGVQYQGADGDLWAGFTDTPAHDTGMSMAPGTSPSNAHDAGDASRIAFHAHNDNLFVVTADLSFNTSTGDKLAPRTSPSMVATAGGGFDIAFQGANGHLWLRPSFFTVKDTGQEMAPATSPAALAAPSGGVVVAYQAPGGELRVLDIHGNVVPTGLTMATGTSPSIAIQNINHPAYIIYVSNSSNNLAEYEHSINDDSSVSSGTFVTMFLAAGSSPSISGVAANSTLAFHDSRGDLWVSQGITFDTGLPIAAGSSPMILVK
jgi:hypothetical protein